LSVPLAWAQWQCYDELVKDFSVRDACKKDVEESIRNVRVHFKVPGQSMCQHLKYGDHECPYNKDECLDCRCCGLHLFLSMSSANPEHWGPDNLEDALGTAFNSSGRPNDGSMEAAKAQGAVVDDDLVLHDAKTMSSAYFWTIKMIAALAETEDEDSAGGLWEAVRQLRNAEGICFRNTFWFNADAQQRETSSSRRSGPNGASTSSNMIRCPPWDFGTAVLEADRIISPQSKMTLTAIVQARCPHVTVEQPDAGGRRNYAQVKILLSEEEAVRLCIKQFAKEKGKRTNIKIVRMSFNSPPDSPRI